MMATRKRTRKPTGQKVTLTRGDETRVVENPVDLARAKYDGFREKRTKRSSGGQSQAQNQGSTSN